MQNAPSSRPTPLRRRVKLVSAGTGLVAASCGALRAGDPRPSGEELEIGPAEDLMREHGVLRRVLVLYDEIARRLDARQSFAPQVLVSAGGVIRRVIEDYHERIEEEEVFPRMERARREVELVRVLREQHAAGRRVTDEIVALARGQLAVDSERQRLAQLLASFNRMYRPHAAREDTQLFPAFHALVGEHAYDELGEQFEERERELLGEDGFEGAVAEVAKLEAELGLADLAQFTPA